MLETQHSNFRVLYFMAYSRKSYSYGCLMAGIPAGLSDRVFKNITRNTPSNVLYYGDAPEEHGIERYPHITIKYGFKEDTTIEEISEAVKGFGLIKVKITKLELFKNADFNVLKLGIESDDLKKLEKKVSKKIKTSISKYKKYNPHITIAYINKDFDADKLLTDTELDGKEFVIDELIYNGFGKSVIVNLTDGWDPLVEKINKIASEIETQIPVQPQLPNNPVISNIPAIKDIVNEYGIYLADKQEVFFKTFDEMGNVNKDGELVKVGNNLQDAIKRVGLLVDQNCAKINDSIKLSNAINRFSIFFNLFKQYNYPTGFQDLSYFYDSDIKRFINNSIRDSDAVITVNCLKNIGMMLKREDFNIGIYLEKAKIGTNVLINKWKNQNKVNKFRLKIISNIEKQTNRMPDFYTELVKGDAVNISGNILDINKTNIDEFIKSIKDAINNKSMVSFNYIHDKVNPTNCKIAPDAIIKAKDDFVIAGTDYNGNKVRYLVSLIV